MSRPRKWLQAACLAGLAALRLDAAESPADAQRYSVVHGWPVLPEGEMLGQVTGVGVTSTNRVFVFHRADREWIEPIPDEAIALPTVLVFDGETGEQVATWGADRFAMPHGLTVDGEDKVWLTDVGRHQVYRFSQDGELLLTLGEAGISGDDERHFNRPTDVAVLPDGRFYVSDGYLNTRVVRFLADGRFQMQWGTAGSGPGQFNLPHGIEVDRTGRVYVADRENFRVQVFDDSGGFLAEWKGPEIGHPFAVAVGAEGAAFVIDGGNTEPGPPKRSRAVRLTLDGERTTAFGRYGNYDGQFVLGHDIAVGPDGAVYVADAWGNRVQKFVPR